jgi:hypothetical protein
MVVCYGTQFRHFRAGRIPFAKRGNLAPRAAHEASHVPWQNRLIYMKVLPLLTQRMVLVPTVILINCYDYECPVMLTAILLQDLGQFL